MQQPESPQNQRPFSTLLRRSWSALTRRPFMKLSALLIAVVFWAAGIASDPTLTIEKTIVNAPVTISGQETLRSKGLIVMDDLTSETITVRMRVEVKQADYDRANERIFTPRLDLSSQITHEGRQQRINITVPETTYGTVLSIDPEYIEVDVEQFTSRRVPVVPQMAGETPTPLWIAGLNTDPALVTVSGPKSFVDLIQRAVVTLPMNSLSAERPEDRISALIELQDASGNAISSPLLRITNETVTVDSVQITLQVYPMQDLPVDVQSAVTGHPAHGYAVTGVRVEPETISVAADQATLDELEALYLTTPVDVTGLKEATSVSVPLRSTADIAHMAVREVTVSVDIAPANHVHAYNNLSVTVMGREAGLAAKLSHDTMDVIIRGAYDQVQALRVSDITLYVDAAGLGEGVHMVDVQCLVNGTDQYEFEPELPRVTLTLTKSAGGV